MVTETDMPDHRLSERAYDHKQPGPPRNGAVDTWTSNSARAHRGDNTWG